MPKENPLNNKLLAKASAKKLNELFAGLLSEKNEGLKPEDLHKTLGLLSGLLAVLVERRNKGEEQLTLESIANYLKDLNELHKLATGELGIYSKRNMKALESGLAGMGWLRTAKFKHQPQHFFEQIERANAYLKPVFEQTAKEEE